MKTLRKSLNGHKDHHHISTPAPLPALSKPSTAIQPPKKVIRAIGVYKSTAPQELSFEKGDFFHVLHDNGGLWYEAHNPMTGARGLVPSHLFEEFAKGTATPRSPKPSSPSDRLSSFNPKPSPSSPKLKTYYAIVLHDFTAERADELDAKSGDPITVVAQSNREWFVAKPIGRLGRPGLIPVSFVEIRDPATGKAVTDLNALIDSGELPRVEEWKKAVLNYKANSISLGVLDEVASISPLSAPPSSATFRQSSADPEPTIQVQGATPLPSQPEQPEDPPRPSSPKLLPDGILLHAEVKSYHYEADEYWFRVQAVYQPYPSSQSHPLPLAKELVLFRSYNDFYDFQVELLEAFPYEAGRPDTSTRVLPYMPGPVDVVDNEITISRREELDEYLHKLAALKSYARYIVENKLVRLFFSLKPGDGEVNVEARKSEIETIGLPQQDQQPEPTQADPVGRMSQLRVSQHADNRLSDASRYEDEVPARESYYSQTHGQELRTHSRNGHGRAESVASLRRPSDGLPIRSHSPQVSQSYSRTHSPAPSRSHTPLEIDPYEANTAASRSSLASSHDPSPVSMRSSQNGSVQTAATSASGRSRSASNAAYNPPISATNPTAAFLKIKIFDRVSDDLVAIRVHPRVTHAQLVDKVQARLGGDVLALRYRDSLSNEFIPLDNDANLRGWLDSTDRHVLYAE
ncbi:uncharacterized protein BXZ73DRAFT_40610 [Epithele typhae]|uniref:uncharacterized protein n=1 Tax=Epithele typhae TaxID=378194 RepID=UPI0020089197|nr:uncharacterized protein BXZ73DRAFT_40610 [Epithele typhae]KAH9943021.1 hypothetical protein BXZ73DRAFT_40610 [Epithele typhae]